MSQRDGFASGFIVGTIVGGLVGGVIGALVATGRDNEGEEGEGSLLNSGHKELKAMKSRKRQLKAEEEIEVARRSLEDKIAQLNMAIDDVRQQLGTVNGNADPTDLERSLDP
jgi:ABC-type siderophore export system fused ATPase/permease subunit